MVVAFHDATLATRQALPLTWAGLSPAGSRQLPGALVPRASRLLPLPKEPCSSRPARRPAHNIGRRSVREPAVEIARIVGAQRSLKGELAVAVRPHCRSIVAGEDRSTSSDV